MYLGRPLLAGASKYLGKALNTGKYLGKVLPQISKGLTTVQRLASSSALQQAGQKVGIGSSVFQKIGNAAGTASQIAQSLPGVGNDVRAGLTAANASLTPARRSIGELYKTANSGN
jgi:prophage DNA circulation protein